MRPNNYFSVRGIYHYYFEYDLKEKNGKQYIEITKYELKYDDIERVYFNMNFLKNQLGKMMYQEIYMQIFSDTQIKTYFILKINTMFSAFFHRHRYHFNYFVIFGF